MRYKKVLCGFIVNLMSVASVSVFASDPADYVRRVNLAANALKQIRALPDSQAIPDKLLADAQCIASIPHVYRAGFLLAYAQGYGLVSCKTSPTTWSEASYIKISTPSFGFQIGGDRTNLILIFIDSSAVNDLSKNTLTLEGDASISAGPVGRSSQAGVDYRINSRAVAYSKSKGVFAGVSLDGAVLTPDEIANRAVYGGNPSTKNLLTTPASPVPTTTLSFTGALP